MSRVFTDGAEMGDVLFWDIASGITAASGTPAPASGAYCYKENGTSYKNFPVGLSEFYFKTRILVSSSFTNAGRTPLLRSSTTEMGSIRGNALQKLDLYVGTTYITGSASSFSLDTWYLMELYWKIADSNGRIILKIDGNEEIDFTGDTKPGAQTTIDNFGMSCGNYCAFDDLALNDTQGSSDISWCGGGRIIALTPDADDVVNNWLANGTGDNFTYVDETPPDGDTTYLRASGTATATYEELDCEAYTLTGTTILGVYVEARARKDDATVTNLRLGVRPPGSLVDLFHSGTPLTESYTRVVGDWNTVNPYTDLAWVDADLDDTILCLAPGEPFLEG